MGMNDILTTSEDSISVLFGTALNGLPNEIRDAVCEFAKRTTSVKEGFLAFDKESGRIFLCNEAFMQAFGMTASPLGLAFSDVFSQESALKGGAYFSKRFLHSGQRTEPFFSIEISLGQEGGHEGTEGYYVLFISVPMQNRTVMLCCLKRLSDLVTVVPQEKKNELEQPLYEQNVELQRLNAQLRIENAERSAVIQALRRAESRYRDIFDNASEGIFQWTPDWRLLSANMSFAKIMGHSTVNALLMSVADGGFHFCFSPAVERELVAELERKGNISNFEFQIVRHDGTQIWASMNARRVVGHGGYTSYYEAFIENIASRKLTEEKLVYQAFHDPLTGLANRALFQDRLRMSIRRAGRQPSYSFSVLYLDLDRFKMVNDSFGHNTGDDVLCHAAVEILSCIRDVDTVARFGGDEFAILIDEMEKGTFAVQVAKRIHTALSRPFTVKGQEINIGASIGIVLRGETYELPEEILRDADTAMYRAKSDHGVCYKVFSQKMREETVESIVFETDMRQGMKNREFYMAYQPVVFMDTGQLYGFEALLRWNRKGENVSPAYFIPVAEETGLIKSLGLYLIEEVCRQVAEWKKLCPVPFVTHLNISGRQLEVPGFSRDVQGILERTGVDPSYLRFEITESVLLDNGGACIQGIQHIRDLGVNFCLDDFGTGFSSLSYLRQLPLSCIKVDRSFVLDIETDEHSLVILRNLLTLGQDLGLSVIVEGIERKQQVDAVLSAGCTLAQGYYYHRPLDAAVASGLLHETAQSYRNLGEQ